MQMRFNPILAVDSYKLSHAAAYPSDVDGMFSYIEARTSAKHMIVPFGLQMWMKKFLTVPITMQDIEEAILFAKPHGEPFDPAPWIYLLQTYRGYLPVVIRAVPEGTPVPAGNVLVTIQCTDPKLFWLSSYLETVLQRAVWYPTTVASMDYEIKKDIAHFYRISGANMPMVSFALHDFGGRGVTCAEQAEIGGAAHLVNFMGSDTIEGIRAANYYYSNQMAGYSVPATERSIECSFGSSAAEEEEYLRHVLNTYAKPGKIVSIVIDGYDVFRCAEMLCTTFKDQIIASGAKVVFRPDSGDMMEIVPRILNLQCAAFGYTMTTNGYKKINNVGLLQGDGIDHMTIRSLLGKILAMGYSADNIVFGSGGALLQKVNRDTYKFAQKASAVRKGGKWVGISKNPITDPGKRSKEGLLTLIRSKMTGEYMTGEYGKVNAGEYNDVMQTVYAGGGKLLNTTTLDEVRARCAV
jgi:nicotinamide phosphoribosyltransferase